MKRTLLFISVFLLLMLSASFTFADTAASKNTDGGQLIKKLDEILSGQKQVLARLDEVKQELYVIKIRATQR